MIDHEVQVESLKFQNKPYRDLFLMAEGWEFDLRDIVWDFYVKFINERLGDILDALDISAIVRNKIDSMDIEELEEIVLFIMKKELSAVVNIGALIGFLLGLANILILLI